MAHLVLFHHALGLTDGVRSFAGEIRDAGHDVTTPDLFDGRTFAAVEDGVALAESIGFDAVIERGVDAVSSVDGRFVVAGFSLGVLPAQKLAQTDARVDGAILLHSAVPPSMFGDGWPDGRPVSIHVAESDPFAEEDREAIESLSDDAGADVFTYPGSGHLIAEVGHTDHDPTAHDLIVERTIAFLAAHG